jgi:hypothetical protein
MRPAGSVDIFSFFLCLVIPSRPEPEARTSEESAVLLLQTQIPRLI